MTNWDGETKELFVLAEIEEHPYPAELAGLALISDELSQVVPNRGLALAAPA